MTRLRILTVLSALALLLVFADGLRRDLFEEVTARIAWDSDDDPVDAAQLFLRAARRGDCERAFALFSAATRRNVEAAFRQAARDDPTITGYRSPETEHCGAYGSFAADTVTLRSKDAGRAVVSVSYSEPTGFLIPGFFPTSSRLVPSEMSLVLEDGGWRVDRPKTSIGREGWDIEPFGEVNVHRSDRRSGDPRRESVEAEVYTDVGLDALTAALLEPSRWPEFVPWIREAVRLGEPDARGDFDVRILVAAGNEPVELTFRLIPSGRPRDSSVPWTTIQWATPLEEDERRLFSASWQIRETFPDRRHVTFGLVLQPDQWPDGAAGRMLESSRMAVAVEGLLEQGRRGFSRAPVRSPE